MSEHFKNQQNEDPHTETNKPQNSALNRFLGGVLFSQNNTEIYQKSGQKNIDKIAPDVEKSPVEQDMATVASFRKTHMTKKTGHSFERHSHTPPPIEDNITKKDSEPSTILQKRADLRNSLRVDAINRRKNDRKIHTKLYGEIILDKTEQEERLKSGSHTIFEKIAVRKAGRKARRATNQIRRIEGRLEKSAQGKDLPGKIARMGISEKTKGPELYTPKTIDSDNVLSLLSYQDVLRDKDAENAINRNKENAQAQKYSKELLVLTEEYGANHIIETAESIRDVCLLKLRGNGIKPSDFSKSISWALWDIAKQSYMSKNLDESGQEYSPADPLNGKLEASKLLGEMNSRQIGWELEKTYIENRRSSNIAFSKINKDKRDELTAVLSNGKKNKTGRLSSFELQRLGHLLKSS